MSQVMSPPPVSDRVIAIDVLKGVSLLLVIVAHMAATNFVPEEKWIYYSVHTVLDLFGPSMFVFLSCLGVVFSIKKKRGGVGDKKSRNAVFQRSAIIFLIGCIPNIISNARFGLLSFWFWFILQFMALSQIVTYYALKLPKITRMIIGFLILFVITPVLFETVTSSMLAAGINYKVIQPGDLTNPSALVFWLVFYPFYLTPPLPWLAVPFIASVVGDSLVDAINQGTKEAKKHFLQEVLIYGFVFPFVGMALGSRIVNLDYGVGMIEGINTSPFFHIDGLPEFLILHTTYNVLYSMGMGMLLLALTFYLTEIRGLRGRGSTFLNFYGRFSLSLFAYHALIGLWFRDQLTFWWLVVYVLSVIAVLYYFLKMLVVRYGGSGTLEWLTAKFSRARNASKIFFETQIRSFKEGFQKISKKVKVLFKLEHPVENPVEIYMYEALAKYDHLEPPTEGAEQEDKAKTENI